MTKNMDPAMMQRAQQMMSNPAMAQQAMNQMESMSGDDLKSRLNQVPAAAAAAASAAPVGISHSQCTHGREKGLRHSPCHRRERVITHVPNFRSQFGQSLPHSENPVSSKRPTL